MHIIIVNVTADNYIFHILIKLFVIFSLYLYISDLLFHDCLRKIMVILMRWNFTNLEKG